MGRFGAFSICLGLASVSELGFLVMLGIAFTEPERYLKGVYLLRAGRP